MIQPTNAQQLYPQQGGANAVSINIYNPQAYGNTPQAGQQVPNYTNSYYQIPQASVYQPQTYLPQDAYQQYMMPMQNPIVPQYPTQDWVQYQQPQMVSVPAPQVMQDSLIEQQAPAAQAPVEQAPVEQPQMAQPQVQQPTEPVVEQTAPQGPVVDTEALVNQLKSGDADQKAAAINKIAEHVQDTPEVALQVVSQPIMLGLVDIIKEDTTGLEGPTDKQIEIAQKVAQGQPLTPEEDALAEQLSPRDKANKNRIFALYTLAMILKLQKDQLTQFASTQEANQQQPVTLGLQDLVGYNEIVDVIKNDPRPEVKVAAIQTLRFISDPQDEATVKAVLADALNSDDESIKAAAQEAISSFAATQEAGQQEQAAEQQTQAAA